MYAAAQAFIVRPAADVDAVAGGHGGQGRVGRGEGCRHDAKCEQHQGALSQRTRCSKHWQQLIAGCRQFDTALLCQQYQQYAQREEQQVGRQEGQSIDSHILLCVAQRAAGKVLLHHVLVEARHDDDYEHAAEELLPEVLPRHPVVPHKHARMAVLCDGLHDTCEVEVQLAHHLIYNKKQCSKHA